MMHHLLLANVSTDACDSSGMQPLHHAAASGGLAAVQLLLGRPNVRTEVKDNSGRIPLECTNLSEVTQLLQARPARVARGEE